MFNLKHSKIGYKIAKTWNWDVRPARRHRCLVCGAVCNNEEDLSRHEKRLGHAIKAKPDPKFQIEEIAA